MAKTSTDEDKNPDANTPDADKTPPETPPEQLKVKAKPEKALVIVGKREGFRRAGYAFGKEEVRLLVSDLTAEQVKMLKNEPMLVVTETTQEAKSE